MTQEMQLHEAILTIYPDLAPSVDPLLPAPLSPAFRVVDNKLVSWDNTNPQPTLDELKTAWLSAVKERKVEEFEQRAKTLASDIWLDALVELADAPAKPSGPPAQMPNVTQLKDIHSKLGRARSAAQGVNPSEHNGDPLKAAKAVEDLKWEDL